MDMKKHSKQFLNFTRDIILINFLSTCIQWLGNHIVDFIYEIAYKIRYSPEERDKIEEHNAIEYFKKYGVQCPNCGNWIPKGLYCCICSHCFIEGISQETRKMLEDVQKKATTK